MVLIVLFFYIIYIPFIYSMLFFFPIQTEIDFYFGQINVFCLSVMNCMSSQEVGSGVQ